MRLRIRDDCKCAESSFEKLSDKIGERTARFVVE